MPISSSNKRRWPAVTVGIMLAAAFAFGSFTVTANAEDHRGGGGHRDYGHRGGGWGGGYYGAPPVVYGSPYYAPPVVWGPGLNINIR